jgi:cobalt-zinc-cadmium resistance protein CzcA
MPVLASFLLRRPVAEHDSRIIRSVRRFYGPALARTACPPGDHDGARCALVSAGVAGSHLGAEFIPRLDEGPFTVTTTKPSISLSSAV